MEQGKLDKNLISQPELWRLALVLSDRTLDVALYPPVDTEDMIWRSFRLDPAATNPLKALEDVIYDNPLLLDDFRKVECLTDYCFRMPLPSESTNDDCRTALEASNPDITPGSEIEIHSTGCNNAIVASVQDADIKSFLLRTFYNIRFTDRMAMLCRHFTRLSAGDGTHHIYALTRDRRMTVIILDGSRLLLANDFDYQKPIDAAYYIMASMDILGLDTATAILHLEGADRQEIAGTLLPIPATDRPDTATPAPLPGIKSHIAGSVRPVNSTDMRIIRGKYGRRRFDVPTNITARPTTDFARENIFNIIENLVDIDGIRALDLFAGTGAITFELLSRGAAMVTSVEKAKTQYRFMEKVRTMLGADNLRLIRGDVFKYLDTARRHSMDFVFADPPYDMPRFEEVPAKVIESGIVSPGGIFVIEHSRTRDFSHLPNFHRHVAYGSVNFSIFIFPETDTSGNEQEV